MGVERGSRQVRRIHRVIRSPFQIFDNLRHLDFQIFCIAAAVFPFSVAATNIALVTALALCAFNGKYLSGAKNIWERQRALSLAWIAYLALLPLGLIWSVDRLWGLHVISHQWYWLCVPAISATLETHRRREIFLLILSIGLSCHLLFCLAQMFHWVHFTADGSSATDPTGHIGHIGFGFVYGIWAAWLLHRGLLYHTWKRWGAWLLAAWATLMILLAAGRSGYLIVAVLLGVVVWKALRLQPWVKTVITLFASIMIVAILALGPGKQRIMWTWHSFQAIQRGDFADAEARWSLWYSAVLAWQSHIPMGVGTGGYPVTAAKIKHLHPDLKYGPNVAPAHPHSMYLLVFSRWGPLGLACLMWLFLVWIRTGWKENWRQSDTSGLLALPAIAMALYGISGPGLEEHFSGIFSTLLLGAGLAVTPRIRH